MRGRIVHDRTIAPCCRVWPLFAISLTAFPSGLHAQDYPARNVKIIVPFGAGGPADVYARVLAQHLGDALKQGFVVENRPGAGAIIGTDAVAKSEPDGYTLLMMSNTHTTNESLVPNKPFALMKDFVAVAPVNYSDLLMVIHPSVPAKDLKEFVALAKSKPGTLNYASSGPGTPYHMAGELFKAMSGTDIVHVPHKASGEARSSVLGGHVQMMFDAITTMAENATRRTGAHPRHHRRQALAADAGRADGCRKPASPATRRRSGSASWRPRTRRSRSSTSSTPRSSRSINRPDVKAAWEKQGAVPMTMTPAEFDAYLRKDIEKWAGVVKASGREGAVNPAAIINGGRLRLPPWTGGRSCAILPP